jgi:hypothetical protein
MTIVPSSHEPLSGLDAARLRWQRALHSARGQVTCNRVSRATSDARAALWIVPLVSMLLVLLVAPLLRPDVWLEWGGRGLGVAGAAALSQTAVVAHYPIAADRALASEPDLRGLGGSPRRASFARAPDADG